MSKHSITLSALDLSISYSVKDDSPRGYHTVPGTELKPGDKIVINNYFHEIIEEPTPEEITPEEITNQIIEFFNDNLDLLCDCVEELDSYNGFLGDDRYYSMDELNEIYSNTEPIKLLYRVFYGHDDDNFTVDSSGDRSYAEFNPNRDYFYYNGYGNLVSSNYKDYTGHLDRYLIDDLSENRCYIDTIDNDPDLCELFDRLEQAAEKEV